MSCKYTPATNCKTENKQLVAGVYLQLILSSRMQAGSRVLVSRWSQISRGMGLQSWVYEYTLAFLGLVLGTSWQIFFRSKWQFCLSTGKGTSLVSLSTSACTRAHKPPLAPFLGCHSSRAWGSPCRQCPLLRSRRCPASCQVSIRTRRCRCKPCRPGSYPPCDSLAIPALRTEGRPWWLYRSRAPCHRRGP